MQNMAEEQKRLQDEIEEIANAHECAGVFSVMLTSEGGIIFAAAIDVNHQTSAEGAPFRGLITIVQASVKAITAALQIARGKLEEERKAAVPAPTGITFEDQS